MSLETDGFLLIPGVLPEAICDALTDALESEGGSAPSQRAGAVYARRNLATRPAVTALASSPEINALLPKPLRVVRAILFDKVPGANWPVPWHQDLSVIVRERVELPGWGPWSIKAGSNHVQPPALYLEKMLALRLHLYDCPIENGALKVLPGTHLKGRISAPEIPKLRAQIPEQLCPARKGDVLLMRPLLLHASSPATTPSHRRVLHLELAPEDLLPAPLTW
ncbi:MAG: phytanoyl-CoA dioxygenase family protein [Armatimonas sp.]